MPSQKEVIEQLVAQVAVLSKQLEQRSQPSKEQHGLSSEQLAQLDGKPGLKAQYRLAEAIERRVSSALAALLGDDTSEAATAEALEDLKEGEIAKGVVASARRPDGPRPIRSDEQCLRQAHMITARWPA